MEEKKDSKEVKDLLKKAEEIASKDKPKEEPAKVKPEVKEPEAKTPLKVEPEPEPKPEPKPEPDPEKEALKQQVKILTERVNGVENLLKEAAEAAKEMQTQGQPQEELTDEQQLEILQQQQAKEQGQGKQGQTQTQPAFGPQQYFLLGKILDTVGKVLPGAMAKSSGGDSGGPEAVLKQLEFWTNIITKIQGNFISGLKLLPQPVREETFKRMIEPPPKEGGIEK